MDKVRHIMSKNVVSVGPNDNIYEVACLMRDHNVGMLPVVENNQLYGVITDRDIVLRGVAEKKPNSSTVKDIMSSRLVHGHPEMSIDEAARVMSEAQVRRLPVVENNQLIGVVSIGDMAVREPYADAASTAMQEISETHNPHVSSDLQH
ncbi:CBS domain-containing protein [Thermoflavimicrobium daqui]|jgi:CBS domain-containing protein|uniref:CBS domain-containing protein n=1 Tax=Thermoflavimicrobium daqui TaxID=2137476 RepID=A0A364K668_9BACL|nr:CBS domain-containing protein [Thermoflavimicrobium daqui]RAL25680.1 CBS domain-containing protein [Thermoflavimicrobium daqui]